jgi:diguanylate cyclase (GGDEF)-like protein
MQHDAGRNAATQEQPSQDQDREICCSMTSVLLKLVRSTGGEGAVAELLERARIKREPSYLENVDNWISMDEAIAMFEAGVQQTGDPLFARRVGENTLRQHAGTQVATVLRSLGSTEAVLKAVAQSAARLSAVTKMEAIEAVPGHGVVIACAREGFTRRRLHCDWTTGLLAGLPILFGLPLARVEESECQTRGDRQCLYTVSWDAELAAAAADPQQRVTSLEAQLVAMSERLHSAYATVGDLVSTDDLEAVLRRIVERAADAVRAPSHILAVRTDPAADLQVYSHGIDERKAKEIATATLTREAPAGDSTLVVEVASARRQYGHLIARFPGSVEFFPQEHELLSLYAKHAAAVLDMSVALVDCDRIGVWLWDHLEQNLRSLAMSGRRPEQEALLRELVISAEDTPHLREMIAKPQPQFFEAHTEDPFMRELMATLDVVALVSVPIVARDIFVGVLTVAVTDDPQRLRADGDLLERLTGVASLAATAIQNGQLVDKLRHKASHDALTGLLNRLGFRQHIDQILESSSAGQRQVGLLFIDLDDFKQVNDAYGHDAGDELIRKAAHRLEATARSGDGIARLGGDEFAIILADVREVDQVRAAEARVRSAFLEPFTVGDVAISVGASVGGGVWPDDGDTVTELVRHADTAMYEDKARGRRSPAQV